ncbi:MAG: protein kinase [Finegoldia sp.]|nr:protein kinase [Finegoldia sp.]
MSNNFLDRYELIKLNKSNCYSDTYHGYDKALKIDVSIQIYNEDVLKEYPDLVDKYDKLANLSHPNILKIYNIAYNEYGQVCVIFEYLDYANLYQVLKVRNLREDDISYIFYQICDAISFAHKNSIFHGKIYFKDIFVDSNNTTKIGGYNFGASVESDISYLGEFLDNIFRMDDENNFSKDISEIRDKCIYNKYKNVNQIMADLEKTNKALDQAVPVKRSRLKNNYSDHSNKRTDKDSKKKHSIFLTYFLPIILALIVTILLVKLINLL